MAPIVHPQQGTNIHRSKPGAAAAFGRIQTVAVDSLRTLHMQLPIGLLMVDLLIQGKTVYPCQPQFIVFFRRERINLNADRRKIVTEHLHALPHISGRTFTPGFASQNKNVAQACIGDGFCFLPDLLQCQFLRGKS